MELIAQKQKAVEAADAVVVKCEAASKAAQADVDATQKLVAESAEKIARLSRPIALINKEAVNRAFETTLAEGVKFERRMFHAIFAIEDQKEGMNAFAEKRKPQFRNR